jgi:cell division protein FtsQ
MARKNASTIADDELEVAVPQPASANRRFEDGPVDSRFLDLDDEAESPFLRGQKRVPVRRGTLPRKALDRVKSILLLLLLVGIAGLIAVTVYRYITQSWRFQLESSDNIAIDGTRNISRTQVLDIFGSDIDRNVFFVPLSERKKQLEEIPWVESASVMRLFPNRLRVMVTERTPMAFVEINSHIALIDPKGVIMDLPAGQQSSYSFPVIVGMSDNEPLSTRAARMKIYQRLVKDLDSGGAQYSRDLSDVDLSDPEDVKATVADPKGAVLVHLGSSDFLERFRVYVSHVQEWRAQFPVLKSVDLRYQHQVIVNPDEASNASAQALAAVKKQTAAPGASAGQGGKRAHSRTRTTKQQN